MTTYNFPVHTKGTTFNGVVLNISINQVLLDLTGVDIEISFNKGEQILSTDNGGVVLTAPTLGKFTVVKQIIDWRKDRYKYEMTFTFPNGDVKKYLSGVWSIE